MLLIYYCESFCSVKYYVLQTFFQHLRFLFDFNVIVQCHRHSLYANFEYLLYLSRTHTI